MNELKPCPFCGESRMLEIRSKERKDRDKCKFTAEVVCLRCFVTACNHSFDWFEEEAKEKAINAWNRRITIDC